MARRQRRADHSQHDRSERALSSDQPFAHPSFSNYAFLAVLAAGILVRVVVFVHMGYLNNDNHLEVIEYVAHQWIPPHAGQFNQAFHPPLYYFLTASLLPLGQRTSGSWSITYPIHCDAFTHCSSAAPTPLDK